MPIEIEQKLETTIRLMKTLVPTIDDVLSYMQENGGWLPLSDEFLIAVKNLNLTDWAKYYLDEKKFKAVSMLGLVGEQGLQDITDPPKFREELKDELSEFMEEGDFTVPTDVDIEQYKLEYASSDEETQQELSKQTAFMILAFITGIFNYLALMVHGRTICQLVAAAMDGDDDAYRRAIQTDRTVLYLPYFQDRMVKAQFSDDAIFLRKVGDSLKRPILQSRIRYRTLWLTFAILDDEGLLDLPHDQLLDICEQVGVYGKQYGVEDVGHLRKRLNDFRRYQRTSNIF
jgi:hypothetical protein